MKFAAVFLGVCVALSAAAVYKRDTNTGAVEIDWQGAKKHIDDMLKLFQDNLGTASEILGKTATETQSMLGDYVKKANETMQNYAPEVKKEFQNLIANVEATRAKLDKAIKDNTPDMYNTYVTALETVKNNTEAVSANLSPHVSSLVESVKTQLKGLETQFHEKVEEAKKVLVSLQQQLVQGFSNLWDEASKQISTSV